MFSKTSLLSLPDMPIEGVGEQFWMEVIRKMDDVYSDLLKYQTALEEQNNKLEESQQFIFGVLAAMSDILVVCDQTGTIEDVNQSLIELTGKTSAEWRGHPLVELFADDISRKQAELKFNGLQGQAVHDCEMQIRMANGSPMPVSVNCTARFNKKGKSVGMVITGRPVGELRRAYHALQEAHEALKRTQQQLVHSEKMASLGRLVAGVAHELNNPISFVLGNVHVLERYAGRLKEYLDAVHAGRSGIELAELREKLKIDRILGDIRPLIEGTIEGAERTRDIVDGLKRFSAIDREEECEFNLVEIIQRAVHWVTNITSESFQVEMDLPHSIPVLGSAAQIQQVIMNLVQNAADATAEVKSPRLRIQAKIEKDKAVVEFRDNGSGILPENFSKIFDPFFTTKPVGKGTGLGLAISYGIVERHNGTLFAANDAYDGGTTFVLNLPLYQPAKN